MKPVLPVDEVKESEDALAVLRTETALSRFPLHLLTSTQDVQIELKNQSGAVYWSVSHNSKFGPPGQLAYKIDTLLINRRIEEAGRPVSELIRLGTLPEISRELGFSTRNWGAIRQALLQNASAFITAKITYRANDKTEKWLEAGFTRYQVIFTGENLPNGLKANGVYILLNSIYREVLNNAVFRPLDYDYMKTLPPITQRFYEIVSYQIYAALKHRNRRARLLYSDYCAYSTAKRYFDFDHVKKQMYKVLRPHVQSGYIAKLEYEAITNERGEADWWMYLTPGTGARREYQAFTGEGPLRKPGVTGKECGTLPLPLGEESATANAKTNAREVAVALEPPVPAVSGELNPSTQIIAGQVIPAEADVETDHELVTALVGADLNRSDAQRFAREQPDVCRRQLEFLPFVEKFKTSRGAYLRRAIEGDFSPPAAWVQAQDREAVQRGQRQRRAQELFATNQEKARQSHENRFYGAYLEFLRQLATGASETQHEAFTAFEKWEEEQRGVYFKPPFAGRTMNERALEVFDREQSHLERFCAFFRERAVIIPTFWEWDETVNPLRLLP